ncbi:biotin--[acetyl-CoA-carboxylase] ligase [Tissierella sp. MSJ-40]|uniref:Bifunctional ligase/repressor BirA n=1 Tax=Tissierella simiarum TaxID=2841534 RepID=A0ABS6EBV6_9FIRM|nr:biotin--[acetyl-CoA-carboxylase] ligase [Tissierella simiarum]MBU5439930.1 biotin--[acetyl-CoA-carboxylase] ligase [Tissierella simiarum]
MKNKILKLLKNNKEEFLSGEKISEEFGVTRSAIWKYINTLKEEGYEIESVSRKGYRIISEPDILTYEEVENDLNTSFIGRNIYYFNTISSTNIKAKEIALKELEGTVVIAEDQTTGKGRLGRDWVSSKGRGIWMSIILKPEADPIKVAKITLIGAAAVNKALEDIGIKSQIKWPNDVVINGKKICGILTEMNCELNMINYVVMGIGINVNLQEEDFPKNLIDKATSLKIAEKREINRKKLLANILNRFEEFYIPFKNSDDISKAIEICRENSALINKEVSIIKGEEIKTGKALDINEEGKLVVMFENGIVENIFSGEVSVRGVEGYV